MRNADRDAGRRRSESQAAAVSARSERGAGTARATRAVWHTPTCSSTARVNVATDRAAVAAAIATCICRLVERLSISRLATSTALRSRATAAIVASATPGGNVPLAVCSPRATSCATLIFTGGGQPTSWGRNPIATILKRTALKAVPSTQSTCILCSVTAVITVPRNATVNIVFRHQRSIRARTARLARGRMLSHDHTNIGTRSS